MNYIVTSLFTTCFDPQKDIKWDPNIETLNGWYSSGIKNVCDENTHLLLFYDILSDYIVKYYTSSPYITLIQVPDCGNYSPHDYRWFIYQSFIESNYDDIENIFFTDAQDVIIQSNPFKNIQKGILYCGDEWMHPWENYWSIPRHPYFIQELSDFLEIYQNYHHHQFLNAGILGGDIKIVSKFLDKMCHYINVTLSKPYNTTDMITFNYVLHKYFHNNIKHGTPINSNFKKYEYFRNDVWFIHK
jgi:hypothetical protein